MKEQPKINIVFNPTEKTNEQIVRSIFGMGMNALVQDILQNKNGKYDLVYEK